ncbi:FAD-dependent oxidoreductase [Aquimarina sp. RZ0]|uniref:FAD-dependent oxidoreductase n=1 Tax=Aquimarina sp. RZ0 TaxID=2607730 RepID=UPI0011F3D2DF|nr:FAD-binding oxidoreductase [Aquimarina sp. RZ0]KAA1243805.1 FAD-binding oxidoreductase [Aquimarina sp. RZ0]
MNNTIFDITILGAGIIGVNTAYWINRKYPDKKVLLLDQQISGTGATFYSIGLDFPFGQTEEKKQLSQKSRELYKNLRQNIPDLSIYPIPFFGICKKQHLNQFLSISFEELKIATAEKMSVLYKAYPGLKIGNDEVVLTGCQVTYAKTFDVTNQLLNRYCENWNTNIYETIKVEDIEVIEEGVILKTNFGTIQTNHLVNTSGPWTVTSKMFQKDQEEFRVKKIACFNIENLNNISSNAVVYFFEKDAFILPDSQRKRHIISITSKDWDVYPNPSKMTFTNDDLEIADSLMKEYFENTDYQVIGGRIFCDTYTKDFTPRIYRDKNNKKIIHANGGSGSGFRLAPAIADRVISFIN